jgi:hypothetical protein
MAPADGAHAAIADGLTTYTASSREPCLRASPAAYATAWYEVGEPSNPTRMTFGPSRPSSKATDRSSVRPADAHRGTRPDRLGDRGDEPLEVHAVVHVKGLPELAPHGPRELVGDGALHRRRLGGRRVGEDDMAGVRDGVGFQPAVGAGRRQGDRNVAARAALVCSSSAAAVRRAHTAASVRSAADASIGAVNRPAHGPAPTSPTRITP